MKILFIIMGCIIAYVVCNVAYQMGKIVGVREGRKQALDEIIHREIRSKINNN